MPSKKTQRGKGEGAVYQRSSDGMWCVSVELPPSDDGKRRRKVICRKSKAEAVKALGAAKLELADHGDLITGKSGTVEQWMTYWLENIAPVKVRPRSYANQTTHVKRWVIPELGAKRLDKLAPADVRTFHQKITKATSSGYARNVNTTLKKALKAAVDEDKIRRNPCDVVDAPPENIYDRKGLTLEQAMKLMAYLTVRPVRRDWALWATYLLTGARRGEILALEVDRIDGTVPGAIDLSWQLQRITDISKAPSNWEHRHVDGTLYLARPKSNKGWRVVPLVEPLRSILAYHLDGHEHRFVFTRDSEGSPIRPEWATTQWKRILSKVGLPDDVVLHGSRHTTVDLLLAAGVPGHIVQDIVGHSTLQQTLDYRNRRDLPQLQAAMNKMSALLSGRPTQ